MLFLLLIYYLVQGVYIDASPVPQPLFSGKSLYRPHALPDDLEHCVELSSHYLFVYLGRRAPKRPMPEKARGE